MKRLFLLVTHQLYYFSVSSGVCTHTVLRGMSIVFENTAPWTCIRFYHLESLLSLFLVAISLGAVCDHFPAFLSSESSCSSCIVCPASRAREHVGFPFSLASVNCSLPRADALSRKLPGITQRRRSCMWSLWLQRGKDKSTM